MADGDVIVVGAGLAGLVAACEVVDRGRSVLIVDQENAANLGGQAFWSFGGLFFVDSPEQRRLGIRDSHELALQDWLGTAGFDRPEDHWPRQWAHAYVDFAAGEKHSWLRERGLKTFALVGWAERGGTTLADTATRCRASTSPGAPVRRSSTSSPAGCSRPGGALRLPSPGRRTDRRRRRRSRGARRTVWPTSGSPAGTVPNVAWLAVVCSARSATVGGRLAEVAPPPPLVRTVASGFEPSLLDWSGSSVVDMPCTVSTSTPMPGAVPLTVSTNWCRRRGRRATRSPCRRRQHPRCSR